MGRALAVSVLLHAAALALLAAPGLALRPPARPPAAMDVRLREPPLAHVAAPAAAPVSTPVPTPRLMLPKETKLAASPHASAARTVAAAQRDGAPRSLSGAAAQAAHRQMAQALLYPREAIESGIEGEATVLLFLDDAGNAIAARLEASSGHAILDEAAVRAARTLRGLPEAAPREALLPVRFRLR